MLFFTGRLLLVAGALTMAHGTALAAEPSAAPLTTAQIVEQMQIRNQRRNDELKQYHSVRHYSVEYKGFSTTIDADMVVDASFDAGSGKSLRIVSESGSKFLCDKVLKRAVDSEKEASQDKSSTAMTTANYRFELVGAEAVGGRPSYILSVDPITPSKFLYRGKVWVDAADFAVVKVDAEPSKSPSFFIARTLIRFSNTKTGDFWLPEQTRSETRVRIGGTAVLAIRYGSYQVVPPGEARSVAGN